MKSESPLKVHGALFAVAFLFSLNYIISKFGMRTFERPDHPSATSGNRKEPDHLVVPQR